VDDPDLAACQVPRYWRKWNVFANNHSSKAAAPDPIGEIIEVDDMYLDKVMADTMDKDAV
jgi:hypothetical protein